jgi:hypothetical protein
MCDLVVILSGNGNCNAFAVQVGARISAAADTKQRGSRFSFVRPLVGFVIFAVETMS